MGYTNKASNWFTLITEDEIKARLVRNVERSSSAAAANFNDLVGPVKVTGGFGYYLKTGPCYFISVLKRVGPPTGYDNDYGDPDFVGHFRICRGLTVTPEQFIDRIGLANKEAEGRYQKVISGTSASAAPIRVARVDRGNSASGTASTAPRITGR